MPDTKIDEHFLMKYRALLDAETDAFDELEHAFEDGDRAHFLGDFEQWRLAMDKKLAFLKRSGLSPSTAS